MFKITPLLFYCFSILATPTVAIAADVKLNIDVESSGPILNKNIYISICL